MSDCLPPWPLFICFPFPLSSCLFLSAIALLVSPVIDYCSFGNHSCQHECVSIPNGHYCRCHSGFTLQPDGKSCRGRSWCLCVQHVPLCPAQSPGKSCPKPPQMGITPSCLPATDLCNGVDHGCEFKCVSTDGSYHCVCPEGQQLQADGKTCSSEYWDTALDILLIWALCSWRELTWSWAGGLCLHLGL